MLSPDNSARQRAVQAALRVVAARGIEHLTTRSLAREVGLTQPAMYRHFNGKNALIREVHHAVAALFRQALVRAWKGRDPEDRLWKALHTFQTFALRHPHYFDVIFVRPPLPGAALDWSHARRRSTIFQFLVDRVADCMRNGTFRRDDPVAVALTLAAHAHGLVVLYRRARFRSAAEFARFYRRSFERLFGGLR